MTIDCGADKVIAYGFTVHHSSVRGASAENKECLRANNKICNIGERTCTVKSCRQDDVAKLKVPIMRPLLAMTPR